MNFLWHPSIVPYKIFNPIAHRLKNDKSHTISMAFAYLSRYKYLLIYQYNYFIVLHFHGTTCDFQNRIPIGSL